MCKKISKSEEQTVYIICMEKPYLCQSESQNPETIIHKGKNSSIRRKGLGFLVVFIRNLMRQFYGTKKDIRSEKHRQKRKTEIVSLFLSL